MYQVVCTKTLDNADANEYLSMKMSMHKHRALVKIEDASYLIAIVENGGLLDRDNELW